MRSGVVAGAVSAAVFALVHGLFISEIWFSLPMLLAAGALCGICLIEVGHKLRVDRSPVLIALATRIGVTKGKTVKFRKFLVNAITLHAIIEKGYQDE